MLWCRDGYMRQIPDIWKNIRPQLSGKPDIRSISRAYTMCRGARDVESTEKTKPLASSALQDSYRRKKNKEKNSLLSFLALRRTISDKLSKIWQKFSRNRPALFGRILGFKLFQPFFPVALASPTRGRTQEKGSNQANGSP